MPIPVNACHFEDLSSIEVRFYASEAKPGGRVEVLVISFEGTYRFGSSGSPDARYMLAMTDAGLAAWEPRGLILDFSRLRYRWGDEMEFLIPYNGGRFGDCFMPSAVVVGPHCEEAIRTLMFGEQGTETIESVGWIFRDLDSAWSYVKQERSKNSSHPLEPPSR